MAFAVELDFDPKTEGVIRAAWQRLAELGVSTGMADAQVRPHVTLSMAEEIDEDDFLTWLRGFAVQVRPFKVLFQAIGIFPTAEGVVYFTPTVTQSLLDVHASFHRTLPESWRNPRSYYLPGRWVPHCTAALFLKPVEIPAAITACMQTALPIEGQFEWITLIETHPRQPIREIETIQLGGKSLAA